MEREGERPFYLKPRENREKTGETIGPLNLFTTLFAAFVVVVVATSANVVFLKLLLPC